MSGDRTPETETPRPDAAVFNDLRDGLSAALRADREMAEADPATDAAGPAAERFDAAIDKALLAYSDLVNRGVIGLFEDTLIERGMAGDADETDAEDAA